MTLLDMVNMIPGNVSLSSCQDCVDGGGDLIEGLILGVQVVDPPPPPLLIPTSSARCRILRTKKLRSPPGRSPGLPNVPSFKPRVGQNVYWTKRKMQISSFYVSPLRTGLSIRPPLRSVQKVFPGSPRSIPAPSFPSLLYFSRFPLVSLSFVCHLESIWGQLWVGLWVAWAGRVLSTSICETWSPEWWAWWRSSCAVRRWRWY